MCLSYEPGWEDACRVMADWTILGFSGLPAFLLEIAAFYLRLRIVHLICDCVYIEPLRKVVIYRIVSLHSQQNPLRHENRQPSQASCSPSL